MTAVLRRATLCVAFCGVAACGSSPAATDGDGGAPFVAFAADFAGYTAWTAQTIEGAQAAGATHVSGKRTVYVNQLPPPGATEFPVGTIIVKVTEADGKIFARAKRGGAFNAKGAVGWEWFELLETAQQQIVVKWRGVGPPLGEVYGGDPNAGCNMCHKLAVNNDFVLAPGVMLAPAGGETDAAATSDASEADAGADAATTGDDASDATHE